MTQPSPHPPPAIQRWLPGVFYGWVVVAAASALAFVVVGVGFYCLAVLFDGLVRERGWPGTSVAFATTLFFVTTGVSGIAVGRWVDRSGARVSFVPGAVLMAGALVWIGRIEQAWQLYLAYPLFAVGFSMAGSVPNNTLITRWFVARRSLAMSVSQTGVSLGGVVLVPIVTASIVSRGVEDTTRWLAAMLLVAVALVTATLVRSNPESVGLEPDGNRIQPGQAPTVAREQRRVWSSREALATRAFWVAVAAFAGILFCQVGTAMHQIALLRDRLDATDAAFAMSTTATGSIVARLVVGSLADRVSKRAIGAVLMFLQAGAIAVLGLATDPAVLFVASLVFGFTIGNIFMLQSLIVGELFGMASFGRVLGLLQLITQTASGLAPVSVSLLVAALGSYRLGLMPLVALAIASGLILLRLRPPPAA